MKIKNRKKKIKFKESTTINCSCCAKSYPIFAGTQGYGCASYFYHKDEKYTIICHYGSIFDTLKFNITNNHIVASKHIAAMQAIENNQDIDDRKLVICDKCVEKFLENQDILEDKEYAHLTIINEMQEFHNEDPQLYMEIISEGPEKCVGLMRQERAKPMEQREQEKQERLKTK